MPRDLQRSCLQDGLKLDLASLLRRSRLVRNGYTPPIWLQWTSSYWGVIATGTISASMVGDRDGWFSVCLDGGREERFDLTAAPRHFGGRQWYFICPLTGRRCSVLWRPNGATRFASRQAWGPRRVAYRSQFLDQTGRAHHQKSKISNRLCERGGFDPDEWDFPPRPKWMRQRTYERIEAAFDRQEDILDGGLAVAAVRLMAKLKC